MKTKGRLLLAVTVTIGLGALGMFACTGPEGPAGPPGTAGTSGAQGTPGPQGNGGPEGIPGAAGLDGGIATSCLSPCHGFNGIVEQWKTSTHYAVFIANLNGGEVASWTGAGNACGNCHAIDGIERRVAGQVGTLADGGVMNATTGEVDYRHPGNGSLQEATYSGSAKVAAVTCVTCHQVNDQNDPHRTGATYTPGSFPLRVANGANDQAMIEKSPDKTAVTGTAAGAFGGANTCIFCHKSRKDVTNYISATTNKLSSPFWGPHEGPQSDVFSGIGGYHFAGKTYDGLTATHRAKLTCVDCHMPSVQTNGGTPNHSFYAQLSACTNCHVGAKNFDVDGQRSQVRAALLELQNALNTAGYLTRSESAPYDPLSADELADGQFELDRARPTGGDGGTAPVLTADQAGALYNYFIIARGGALGVHNPKYVRQLIFDSFQAITGNAPTKIVRP